MTAVVVTAILCATAVALAVMFRRSPPAPPPPSPVPSPSVLDERMLDYVVLTLKSGTTFGGVLYVEDSGAVVLAKAEQYLPDGARVPADGEIIVLRADVDYIQRP